MCPTFTTQKRSISPTIIMVPHTSDKDVIPLSFPNGAKINALKVNNFTHICERQIQLSLQGPTIAYLVTSGINNVYYLVLWSEEQQQYRCSCYQFRKEQSCPHCEAVPQREAAIA